MNLEITVPTWPIIAQIIFLALQATFGLNWPWYLLYLPAIFTAVMLLIISTVLAVAYFKQR